MKTTLCPKNVPPSCDG